MHLPAPRSVKPWSRHLRHIAIRWWRSLMVVQDTPHRVAWGFAIGLVIGWQMPIMGAQMVSAAVLGWALRGNVVAALAAVWLSNPLTMVPIFVLCNRVGALFVGNTVTTDQVIAILERIGALPWQEAVSLLITELWGAMLATALGGLLFGILSAIPAYFLIKAAVAGYQRRRMERRLRWLGVIEPPEPGDVHPTTVGSVVGPATSPDHAPAPASTGHIDTDPAAPQREAM